MKWPRKGSKRPRIVIYCFIGLLIFTRCICKLAVLDAVLRDIANDYVYSTDSLTLLLRSSEFDVTNLSRNAESETKNAEDYIPKMPVVLPTAAATVNIKIGRSGSFSLEKQHQHHSGWRNEDKTTANDEVISIILLRAVGNALPPRHNPNQTLANLEFTLKHEPKFPRTTRHWMVNRIIDPQVERDTITLLKKYNETFTIDPFNLTYYQNIPYHFDRAPRLYGIASFDGNIEHERVVYTINVNGIRNSMLEYGKQNSSAEYILPWDGNCFLTEQAWELIQEGLKAYRRHNYFYVPMSRVTNDNSILLSNETKSPEAKEEPQVVFARNSSAIFNPGLAYGRRNKIEIFNRIEKGRPKWERKWQSWERGFVHKMKFAPDAGKGVVPSIGWVARLSSGAGKRQETDSKLRYVAREAAIGNMLATLDARVLVTGNATELLSLDIPSFNDADKFLNSTTRLLAVNSSEYKFDLAMQHTVVQLVMGYKVSGDNQFAEKAAAVVTSWIVSKNQGCPIKRWFDRNATSFPQFLAAVDTLTTDGVISVETRTAVVQRVGKWLAEAENSAKRKIVKFNPKLFLSDCAIWFDLQIAAVSSFVGDYKRIRVSMHRALERLDRLKDENNSMMPTFVSEPPCAVASGVRMTSIWADVVIMAKNLGMPEQTLSERYNMKYPGETATGTSDGCEVTMSQ